MLTEERLAPAPRRPAEPVAAASGGPRWLTSPAAGVTVLAAASGAAALVVARTFFPDMSDNNDEGVYRLQADALRAGHLFPPAPPEAESARPWLNVVDGNRYIPKYVPLFPVVIAASRIVTGSDYGALAVVAAAVVLSAYWLAREILGDRRQALLAAGILAASPAVLMQSGVFLSYLLLVALMQGGVAALIGGVRRGSPRMLAAAGLLGGLGLFARPYDAVLVAVPFMVWWAVTRRGDRPAARRDLRWLAAGAALPVAAMFAYFWAATGSPLRPPFSLLHPDDRFGFGDRQMYHGDIVTPFTPARGLIGSARHVGMVAVWGFGGFVLVGLALAGLRRLRGPGLALAAVAVTVPVGYVFFWGIWGSAEWGGPGRVGPFYTLPMFTVLAVLGARGLTRLWSWDRALAGVAVAGMAVVSVAVFSWAVDENRPFRAERARLYEPLRDLPAAPAVIFLPPLQKEWLGHPFSLARNGSLDGPMLWAIDRGDEANRRFLRSFPGRTAYRLVADRMPGEFTPGLPHLHYTTRLEPFSQEALPCPTTTLPTPPATTPCSSSEPGRPG